MKISFDLDDTLIPGTKTFDTEDQNLMQRLARIDKIRKGTIGLFKELRSHRHSIYIYTTSFRPAIKTKLAFLSYGIPVDKVINQQCHDKELKENKTKCSKFPPAFGIDIHVDDSPGVEIEGNRFNFKTIIIGENDLNWTEKVLKSVGHGHGG
jgi:hypothetical protein